jgi:hypothetical protein
VNSSRVSLYEKVVIAMRTCMQGDIICAPMTKECRRCVLLPLIRLLYVECIARDSSVKVIQYKGCTTGWMHWGVQHVGFSWVKTEATKKKEERYNRVPEGDILTYPCDGDVSTDPSFMRFLQQEVLDFVGDDVYHLEESQDVDVVCERLAARISRLDGRSTSRSSALMSERCMRVLYSSLEGLFDVEEDVRTTFKCWLQDCLTQNGGVQWFPLVTTPFVEGREPLRICMVWHPRADTGHTYVNVSRVMEWVMRKEIYPGETKEEVDRLMGGVLRRVHEDVSRLVDQVMVLLSVQYGKCHTHILVDQTL